MSHGDGYIAGGSYIALHVNCWSVGAVLWENFSNFTLFSLLRTRNMCSECVVFSFNPSRNSQYMLTWTGPMARSDSWFWADLLANRLVPPSPPVEDKTNSHSPGQRLPRCTAPFVASAHACALSPMELLKRAA